MRITITGLLVQGIYHFGGETTGWELRLDDPIELEGHLLTAVEVNHDSSRFSDLENKFVEVSGELTLRHGIERESWPVLEVETIREIPSR